MRQNRPTHPCGLQTLGLLDGSCVLLLYLVTATPLAPALTALLAASDCSHRVAIQQTVQGLQVVLRHDCPDSSTHRHGIVARALTVFAQRSTAPQSDHVIQFGTIDTAQRTPALAIEPALKSPASDGYLACDSVFHAADVTVDLAGFPRPPPDPSGFLLTIRSTVLLI